MPRIAPTAKPANGAFTPAAQKTSTVPVNVQLTLRMQTVAERPTVQHNTAGGDVRPPTPLYRADHCYNWRTPRVHMYLVQSITPCALYSLQSSCYSLQLSCCLACLLQHGACHKLKSASNTSRLPPRLLFRHHTNVFFMPINSAAIAFKMQTHTHTVLDKHCMVYLLLLKGSFSGFRFLHPLVCQTLHTPSPDPSAGDKWAPDHHHFRSICWAG